MRREIRQLFQIFAAVLWILANAFATEHPPSPFKEGHHYVLVGDQYTEQPTIELFFSFDCPQCYLFCHTWKIQEKAKQLLPPHGIFRKVHMALQPKASRLLTKAWALGLALECEEAVEGALFKRMKKGQTIRSEDALKTLFKEIGIAESDYQAIQGSIIVAGITAQQWQYAKKRSVVGLPTLVINGRYRIETASFDVETEEAFTEQYLALVKWLLTKQPE